MDYSRRPIEATVMKAYCWRALAATLAATVLLAIQATTPVHGTPSSVPTLAEKKSYLPKNDLAMYLVRNLDVRSIGHDLIDKTVYPASPQLLSSGIRLKSVRGDKVVLQDESNAQIILEVKQRGDYNRDGIEDVRICLTIDESTAGGSDYVAIPLLVQQYGPSQSVLALAVPIVNFSC